MELGLRDGKADKVPWGQEPGWGPKKRKRRKGTAAGLNLVWLHNPSMDCRAGPWTVGEWSPIGRVELRLPMLCNSPVLDYLNMRDEGGLVKGLVKVEIACFGQHRR